MKYKSILCSIFAMGAVAAFALNDRPTVTFYVAVDGNDMNDGSREKPVKTPERALELVRSVASDAKREIVFADGYYSLEKPIRVETEDSDLTIRAENRGKAFLSGAKIVSGWRKDPKDARFLIADLPLAPSTGRIYAFSVADKLADVAVYPAPKSKQRSIRIPIGEEYDENNFTTLPYDIKSFPKNFDPADIDIASVWVTVLQEWAATRCYIATNDYRNHTLYLGNKSNMAIGRYNGGFTLHNSRIGMHSPGTWMFEETSNRLIYWPRVGEDPTKERCTISGLMSIFDLRETRNVTIDGFIMDGVYKTTSTKHLKDPSYSAAISSRRCSHLTVRHCEIRNLASAALYALKSGHTMVSDCHIHDIGSSGICFARDGEGYSSAINNHIHHNGWLDRSSCQILLQGPNMTCIGNYLHDAPRECIVMWSSFSLVASNRISNAMLKSRDGAGLYGAYDYSLVKDNYVKYDKESMWPGLYADEGSQHTVFTGNYVEGLWWPTHMHQSFGIVVSNNTFKYNGKMRWSFQGGTRSRFVENKIYTTKPITNDAYLANCVEWARNDVYVKPEGKNEYKLDKRVSLKRVKATKRSSVIMPRIDAKVKIDGKGPRNEYPIHWRKIMTFGVGADGYPEIGGEPSYTIKHSYDGEYVNFCAHYKFGMLISYVGMRNFGNVWGRNDGMRFYFGNGYELTVYWNGETESNNPKFRLGKEDFIINDRGWWHGIDMEFRIPLAALGLSSDNVRGKEIAFNAVGYNGDHDFYRYVFPIEGNNILTGKMVFPKEDLKEVK